jgi:hypothetical protein
MWSHWFTVARSYVLRYYGEHPLKTAIEKIGEIETVDVSGADHLVTDLGAPGTRVSRDERLAVVKRDLDQVSKELSHFTDVIGNRP